MGREGQSRVEDEEANHGLIPMVDWLTCDKYWPPRGFDFPILSSFKEV